VNVGGRVAIALATMIVAACAARAPLRPSGAAVPDPTAADAFVQATKPCAGLKTMTGALHLSGRAGAEKIRGTLHTGLEAPAAVRFEAVAPFGQPFFILAGRDDRASLLLPRENRVLTDASVPALLERLTGLALSASDLRLILTGCIAERAEPSDGRSWPNGWRAVTLGAGVTAYLRTIDGAPAVVAADRGPWRIDYAAYQNGWPRMVRIRGADTTTPIDISASIEDLEVNTSIDAKAFTITAPPGAAPMTIDELRSVQPLREGK
jgi:outer membrane biogenesis lipoprotein LolB